MSSKNATVATEITDDTPSEETAKAGNELPDFEVIPVDGCLSSLNAF
ncbi:hypothetical protein [Pandoraea bronchicola]|uniref:Uncharacterized protein n=1 Tax=Pandoraea bronchicola TaxID=2508287 RepID=A0A5E5BRJ2_9BURK|nr:hypothetical protein [Pandoraea bronchicola]VVE86920.1 hypothetical protein PBR20603_00844 [Pandoraea bronchicola]